MTERYLAQGYGPEEDQLIVSIAASIELAKKHESRVTILVPTLRNIKNTILSAYSGDYEHSFSAFFKTVVAKTTKINGSVINFV